MAWYKNNRPDRIFGGYDIGQTLFKPWQQLRGVVFIISYYYVLVGIKRWKEEAVRHWSLKCTNIVGCWDFASDPSGNLTASLFIAEFGWDKDLVRTSFGIFLKSPPFNNAIELSDLGFHPRGELGCLGMRSRYGDTPYFQPTPPNQNPW